MFRTLRKEVKGMIRIAVRPVEGGVVELSLTLWKNGQPMPKPDAEPETRLYLREFEAKILAKALTMPRENGPVTWGTDFIPSDLFSSGWPDTIKGSFGI